MSIWNIFKRKTADEAEKPLREEIKEAIADTSAKIKTLEAENEELNKWSLELINQVFKVPKEFWYQELDSYEKIKKVDKNTHINSDLIHETDSLIERYQKQIEIRNFKITFYKLLLKKYEKALNSALKQEKYEAIWAKEQALLNELEEHKKRIRKMESSTDNQLFEKESELKSIQDEIRDKKENLDMDKKVFHELNQLSQKMDNSADVDEDFYQQEIQRIINETGH